MEAEIPNKYISMYKKKCPNCRKGELFKNKSVFPLKEFSEMPERCSVCNQKYEIEIGFWFGTGYVSYGMSVGLIIALAVVFAVTVGFSYKNDSIYIFLGIVISTLILLQPWIMRYSRVLWIYIFVKYGRGSARDEG